MGFHTFPTDRAESLNDPARYRYCSREELLEMLAADSQAVVADLGSGTGFYTGDVAPFVGTVLAVDVQEEMHRYHLERGLESGVELLTAIVDRLPFADGTLDAAFSTMTHHEYASDSSLAEIARVLRPGGRLVTVDWSSEGLGEDGPPLDERFDPQTARAQLERAGLQVVSSAVRPETFAIVAIREDAT